MEVFTCPKVLATHSGDSPAASAQEAPSLASRFTYLSEVYFLPSILSMDSR